MKTHAVDEIDHLPTDGSLDSVTALWLGQVAREALESPGDAIDHGLRLVRLLHESNFVILERPDPPAKASNG